MVRNLIFLSLSSQVDKALKVASSQDTVVVTDRNEVASLLKGVGIKCKTIYDYFSSNDMENIKLASYEMMKRWGCDSSTFYKGIFLGDFMIAFYPLIEKSVLKIELLLKAIEKEKPEKVLFIGNRDLASVFSCYNIETGYIEKMWFKDVGNILERYLVCGGSTDIKSLFFHKTKTFGSSSKRAKPVLSPLVFDVFAELYPYIAEIISKPILESVLLNILPLFRPYYFAITATNIQQTKTSERNLLALCSFTNSATNLAPIVEALLEKGHQVKCIVTHPEGYLKCKELRLPFQTVGCFLDKEIVERARRDAAKVRKRWLGLTKNKKFKEIFSYKGYNIFDLVRPSIFLMYAMALEYAVYLVNVFQEIFKKEKPRLVMVADDIGFAGRAFILIANAMNISTLNIQHSAIDDVLKYKDVVSDYMAVWGEHSKELLVKHEVPKEKLIITGPPRLKLILNRQKRSTKDVFSKLGIPVEKRIALWTPTCFTQIDEFLGINGKKMLSLSKVFSEREISAKYSLVVKIHPLDSKDLYLFTLAQIKDSQTIVVKDEIDVYDLIAACDFLIVTNSTTGIEAICLDKPIIVINFHNERENVPYVKTGAAIRATTERDLKEAIMNMSDQKLRCSLRQGRIRFVKQYLYKKDREAPNRILNLIERILNSTCSI